MCTLVLHLLACHAFDQETATGAVANALEWWVEQGCQEMKETVVNMGLTSQPAKVIGNDVILRKALINCAREFPEYAALVGLSELTEATDFKGPTDELRGGVQFLHVGKELRVGQIDGLVLGELVRYAEGVGFPTDVRGWTVHEFRAAEVDGAGFQSRSHYGTKARHSFNVQARVQVGQSRQLKAHFATILRFLRVVDNNSGEQIRIAKLIVYGQARREKGLDVIDATQPLSTGEIVDVSCLVAKYMFAKEKGNECRTFVLPCFTRGL
jgi:hypothetical protein